MSKKDENPVEFDDGQSNVHKDSEDQTARPAVLPTSEERHKTEAMDSMDETAILDANDMEDEEKTQLIASPFAKPGRLIVVFGPDQGKEFPLLLDKSQVGRGLDCQVILNDPTVSKHHCLVLKKGDNFLVRDLHSGNGTKLNGEKVSEARLAEGARLELGRTVMTFTTKLSGMPKNSKPAMDVSSDDHQARTLATEMPGLQQIREPTGIQAGESFPWGRIAGLVLLIVLLAGGVVAALQWGFDVNILGMKKTQPVAVQVSPHKKALKSYNKGLGFMDDEKWDMAITDFKEALALEPGLRRASRRMLIAQKEKQALHRLQKADQLIKQNKITGVKDLLTSISRDSVYFTRARSKLLLLTDRQALLDVARVKSMVAAGKIAEGKELFLKLLGKYPGNTAVLGLGKLIEKDIKNKPAQHVKRTAPRRRRPRASLDMNTVLGMYAGGAFSDAVQELRAYTRTVRSNREKQQKTRLANSIQSFAAVYTAGKQAINSDDYAMAIRNLGRAKRLDRGISGKYQARINAMLAKAYRGRSARYVMRKQYVQAVRDARAALGLDPGDKTALMVLNKCHQVAKGYYDSALADLKSGNTAAAKVKLENVMKLVTRDSDLYKQAGIRYQQIR